MAARFTRLVLSNWRNFKRVDVVLPYRVFIVGPNASGKTNLLDAIRFLGDIAEPGGSLINAVQSRRGLKHLRSLHAGNDSNVLVEVGVKVDDDSDEWSYTLELTGSETRNKPLRIKREVVRHGERLILDRPGPEDTDARLLTQTHLEQISQSLEFRPLADALASVLHVHVVPQVVRTPAHAEEYSKRDAPGSDFIDQLARLTESRANRALRRIEKLLRLAVPRFSELKVERDELGKPHLAAKYEHWRRRGGWQNEQEFSDGTLRLIGLLWAIDQGTAPLLLEEPELSLHRDVIRQLPRLFAQAAQRTGRQVIVSTHAEELLSDRGIDPSEVLLLEPSANETQVVVGTQKSELVQAAHSRIPLGRVVTAITKPAGIEQLSLPLASGSRG
jgi:predicted ATPase